VGCQTYSILYAPISLLARKVWTQVLCTGSVQV